jgi:C1A family cysteine protease
VTHHRRFGTHPDLPDARDRVYLPPGRGRLPRAVDLRPLCPPVYDQRTLNSCSAHAIGAALWYDERLTRPDAAPPSRLFIYYNERVREHEVPHDAPVSLRDGYKSVATRGVCPEHMWPYRVGRYARKPPGRCYEAARSVRALTYFRLHRNLPVMKACLAEGSPFTLGVSVHERFMSAEVKRTGVIPLPRRGERLLGGHAMLVVGYHDASRRFIVRNSWGRQWGLEGYCTLPYEFALHPNLAWDFWTCRRVGSTLKRERA